MLVTMERPLLAGFLVSLYFFVLFPFCESQTRPKDLLNCELDASSPFSYVVQVRDVRKEQENRGRSGTGPTESYFNFGCLITRAAVLSTAWTYIKVMQNKGIHGSWYLGGYYNRYLVIGQNIWDHGPHSSWTPCYQNRSVVDIQFHPKASQQGSRMHYDFSVVIMKASFTMKNNIFRPASFPSTPLQLLGDIRFVDEGGIRVICALPVPSQESLGEGARWTFNERDDVSSIPFKSECIEKDIMCAQSEKIRQRWRQPKTGEVYQICKRKFQCVVNGTMLCIAPRWTNVMEVDNPQVPTSYAGVPLLYNGAMLGIVSQVKNYRTVPQPQNFFLVNTLLRIYPWLTAKIHDLTPPSLTTISEDDGNTFGRKEFTKPPRAPTPDWGHGDFLRPLKNKLPDDLGERRPLSLAPAAMYHSSCFWKILTVCHAFHLIYRIHFHQTQAS